VEPTFLSSEPVTVVDKPAAQAPPPAANAAAASTSTGDGPCTLCGIATTLNTSVFVNRQRVCMVCASQGVPIEKAALASHVPAAIGAAVGALVGAAVFAAIGIATDFEIGYVAVLIGFLAGRGANLGARGAFAPSLQLMAAGFSIFGLVAAKYMVLAWAIADRYGVSPVDGRVFSFFADNFGQLLSPFDLLWVALAVGAAFRAVVPRLAERR